MEQRGRAKHRDDPRDVEARQQRQRYSSVDRRFAPGERQRSETESPLLRPVRRRESSIRLIASAESSSDSDPEIEELGASTLLVPRAAPLDRPDTTAGRLVFTSGTLIPPNAVVLYRAMSFNGLRRVEANVGADKPALGNKVRDEVAIGENFLGDDLSYVRQYLSKGKRRKNSVILEFTFDPAVTEALLHNPKYARVHGSAEAYVGNKYPKGISKVGKGERGVVVIKHESLKKGAFRYSTNYGFRGGGSEDEDPFVLMSKYLLQIRIVE